MAQQTPVEWLEKELYIRGPIGQETPIWIQDLFEQAKKMEKQQIINAWIGTDNELQRMAAETYYNETYTQKGTE